MKDSIIDTFEGIFETELLDEIKTHGKPVIFNEGDLIIDIGQRIAHMPLLIEGAIKILRDDDLGEELLLYYLERGDTCAMSMNCCIGNKKSEIRATAETNGILLLVPVQKMEEWMGRFASWRKFVLESYNVRLYEMLEAIDNLAFMNLEERILKYLKEKVKILQLSEIKLTHQEIAIEMHTSRVVVSRLLKALERKRKIKLHRNKIEMIEN